MQTEYRPQSAMAGYLNIRTVSPPTNKIVPLCAQVGLIGQAALHHVKTQRVTGAQ